MDSTKSTESNSFYTFIFPRQLNIKQMAENFNLSICPEDVYSNDQRAFRIFANAPISLFGIISNLLNILVFSDFEMRHQLVNHFLLALSISDLFLLICNFFFLVLPVLVVEMDSFYWNNLFPFIIRYSYPLALTVQTSGVYLTVLVSVHRFLGVCHPFKAKQWVTMWPVECAIIGSILFSFAANIPTWLELNVVPCFSERFTRPSRQIQLADFHDMNYIIAKKCIAYTFLMFLVPFSLLIIINWKIVQALRFSSRMRSNTQFGASMITMNRQSSNENISAQLHLLKKTRSSEVFKAISKISYSNFMKPSSELFKPKLTNSTRDRSITLMLLAIVGLFFFCNGLAFLNSVIESVMLILTESDSYEQLQQNIDHFNSSINATSSSHSTLLLMNDNIQLIHGNEEAENWHQKMTKWFESSVEISNVLITLNSSTSTLVYLIFSTKYRIIFKSIIGLHKRDKLNRVALTTAVAACRVMELSLIPEEVDGRSRRRNACVTATMTTELSSLQKRTFSSIIRQECSLDSPASDSAKGRKRKNEQKQKLAKKGEHFIAQFRQNSTPTQLAAAEDVQIYDTQSSVQLCSIGVDSSALPISSQSTCTTSSSAIQRRTMFRGLKKSSTKEKFKAQQQSASTLSRSMTNFESNLRLMDEQEAAEAFSSSPIKKKETKKIELNE